MLRQVDPLAPDETFRAVCCPKSTKWLVPLESGIKEAPLATLTSHIAMIRGTHAEVNFAMCVGSAGIENRLKMIDFTKDLLRV